MISEVSGLWAELKSSIERHASSIYWVRKMKKKKAKQKSREFDLLQPDEKQVLISFREHIESRNDDEPVDIDDTVLERLRSSPHLFLAALDEIGGIPTRTAARALISLQSTFTDKQSKKAIKKALFKLKQRGVILEVPEDTEKSDPIYKQAEKNEAYGMVSTVDTFGDRLAFLAVPQRPHVWMLGGESLGMKWECAISPLSRQIGPRSIAFSGILRVQAPCRWFVSMPTMRERSY